MLRVRRGGKCQGKVVELVLRDSFNVLQGCTNSGPGRLGILEVMQTDGLGFSLCAMLLEIIGSCISKWHGQNYSGENGGPVCSRPEGARGT